VVRGGEQATEAIEAFNTARWEAHIYEE